MPVEGLSTKPPKGCRDGLYYLGNQEKELFMTQTTQTVQEFFTETEWDMLYNFIGNALDNDDYESEDVYAIRAKIHNLFLPQ